MHTALLLGAPMMMAATAAIAEPAAASTPAPAPAAPAISNSPKDTMTAPAAPAAPAKFEFIEAQGRKHVLVCTVKTVEANRQFQQNVQLVQNQFAAVKSLQKRIEEALTIAEKDALQTKLLETNKSLEQNNAIMAKTYGFSILRQYIAEIGKTRLYTPITDKEYDEAKAKPDFKAEHYVVNETGKFAHLATIDGVANNNIFRQNVQLVQAQRQRLVQLKAAIDQSKDAEKAKLEEEFKKSEETLVKNNAEMTKTYGFSLTRNYVMEIEESKLYMAVTDEEFAKQKAEADKAEAPASK